MRSQRMSPALRVTVMAVLAVLWVSGCVWLVLHLGFEHQSEFGAVANPWAPTLIRVHGLFAVAGVFLLGWITTAHVVPGLAQKRHRVSGMSLIAIAALLLLTGYALYYVVGDAVRAAVALAHEVIGVSAVLVGMLHWRRAASNSDN